VTYSHDLRACYQLGHRHITVYEAVNVAHAASGRAGGFLARSWCDTGTTRLLAKAGLWSSRTGTFGPENTY
jgi:glycine/D-amino acid oxidase-like deaminating enzyme